MEIEDSPIPGISAEDDFRPFAMSDRWCASLNKASLAHTPKSVIRYELDSNRRSAVL